MKHSPINWKVFIILFIGSLIGIIGVIPYSLTLQEDILTEIPIPMEFVIALSIVQSAVLFFVIILVGLFLSKKIGLGVPIIERFVEKKDALPHLKSIIGISITLGIVAGLLIIVGDDIFGMINTTDLSGITNIPPPWQGFLVSFYGGINEEILLRLFFMSLLIWIFVKITRSKQGSPSSTIVWTAIIFSSILFGLAHLPIVASLTTITPLYIARALILNGIGGIIFGWLYWKKGLESAIISHFTADIILHVIFPFFLLM